jgi:hypothetical protein
MLINILDAGLRQDEDGERQLDAGLRRDDGSFSLNVIGSGSISKPEIEPAPNGIQSPDCRPLRHITSSLP